MGYESTEYLVHHGILGMKWGVRRYQKLDGSLTSAGKKRYDWDAAEKKSGQLKKEADEQYSKAAAYEQKHGSNKVSSSMYDKADRLALDANKLKKNYVKKQTLNDTIGTAMITAAYVVPVTAIATRNSTNRGKKMAAIALGFIGTNTVASLYSNKKEQKRIMEKYGFAN